MALTKEQFNALRAKGLSTEQIIAFDSGKTPEDLAFEKKKANEGFISKTFRAITEPVVTLAARPFQLAKALSGATPEEQAITLPYYGKIKTVETGKDVVKDVGKALETVSLGIGGGGAVSTIRTGLKGAVKEAAIQGVKEQGKAGLIMGFGQGLQQAVDEPPEEAFNTIFANTALGGGIGVVGGGVFGGATPLIAKGVRGVRKFANIGELESKLADGLRKIFNPTARQIKADTRFGNNSFEFLAKEAPNLPVTVNSDGRVIADDAIEMARQKYIAEATAYKPIIRNSGKYVDVDSVIANAKKQARQELDGTDLLKAEAQIDNEINAYLANTPQDVNVTANGKRFISLDRADDIKSYSWSRGKGWGSPDAELWNDTNNIIGHAIKDAIEKELPSAPIKAMNRRLGQWKNAIDLLEKRNGQVSGNGGKLSKYIIRSVGTSVGAGVGSDDGGITGGITGAGAGFLTANTLALLMANPNVRLFAIRQILKNLKKAGRTDMIKEAEQILQQESSKYLLPAAGKSSYIEPPQKPIILPQSIREANLGLDEVRNLNQASKAAQIAEPIQAPTIQEKINPSKNVIPKVSNTSTKKASTPVDNLIQEARKYKSAEEFVKAQNLYHGTSADIKSGNLSFGAGEGAKKGGQSGGLFLSDKPEVSQVFGKNVYQASPEIKKQVIDLTKPDGVKQIENFIGKSYKTFEGETMEFTRQDFESMFPNGKTDFASISQFPEVIDKIVSDAKLRGIAFNEYAGCKIGKTYQILNGDITVKTKSQLIDIWNKANKK